MISRSFTYRYATPYLQNLINCFVRKYPCRRPLLLRPFGITLITMSTQKGLQQHAYLNGKYWTMTRTWSSFRPGVVSKLVSAQRCKLLKRERLETSLMADENRLLRIFTQPSTQYCLNHKHCQWAKYRKASGWRCMCCARTNALKAVFMI